MDRNRAGKQHKTGLGGNQMMRRIANGPVPIVQEWIK